MSMRSRREGGGRRSLLATAAVTAGTLLVWLVITALPASAAVTCTDTADIDPGGPVVSQVAVAIGTDSTVALGFSAGNVLQVADNPPADLTAAAWVACGALVNPNVVRITGQNNGLETVRLDNGDGVRVLNRWGLTTMVTFVDLGSGADTFTIETFAAQGLGVEFATSVGGSTVVDADWNVEGLGTDTADIMVTNVENMRAVGDLTATGVADNILAGGDQNASTFDITPVGAGPEDVTVPGTADTAADTTGLDPRGNLTVPLTMNGGVGNDVLEPGNANDAVIGAAGDDIVVYAEAPSGVTVDLTAGTATGGSGSDTLSDVQSVAGSLFADTLTGSAIDNRLSGCGGDDILDGGAGNDTIRGDVVDPGVPPGLAVCPAARDGNDTILEGTAANGSDVIQGDGNTVAPPGEDILDYSGRTAALYVAPGGGAVSGEGGCPLGAACEKDNIAADIEYYMLGAGNDTFVGSALAETIMGGAGDDTIGGGAGFDYLDLSDGAGPAVIDTVAKTATGSGSDTFTSVEGFIGTEAGDTLTGDGTTLACPGPAFDFVGGGGVDMIDGSAGTTAECINLALMGNTHEVENATGGSGDDTITGNALSNVLIGGAGFDIIAAGDGNDFVEGGLGNDTLNGGLGGDTLVYVHATGGMTVDNQLGFSAGPDGQDSLAFFEIIKGSDFADTIIGGQNSINVNNRYLGRGGDDTLIGTNSTDILNGGAGDDNIRGAGGDDILKGAAGDDLIIAGNGDDVLRGGKGLDVCKSIEHKKSCEA